MQITLQIDTDNVADLRAARELIAAQLRIHSDPPAERDVVSALEAMWNDIGDGPKRLLSMTAAVRDPDEEFTLEDARPNLGVLLENIKAWHRNLARTLKARGLEVEDVMPSRTVDGQKRYHFPLAIHTAILELPYP